LPRRADGFFHRPVAVLAKKADRAHQGVDGVRYLAAHFPTQRALLQTTDIASRLMRGGELHREAQAAE